jgi:hypothetical protein
MKPPVVVIGRHCKTNQCWIAVRFKKIQSVAKISQSHAQERADDAPFGKRVPLTASPRNEFYFRHACARDSRKFSFSPPPLFLLWRRVKAHRRAPRSTAERRAPPTRERCLLPVTPDGSGTPIIMQGLPKRPARTADYPKERAQRPRTIPRGSSNHLPPISSPSVRFAKAPLRLAGPETAADQQRRRPRHQSPALVCAQWRARKQPRQWRLLRALLREQPTGYA